MPALSTAVNLSRVSAIAGYAIKASLAGIKAGNLPQSIAVLAEKNTANQAITDPLEFTSANEVGVAFGYGSPAHLCARILRPASGDILGGIPTIIYPIEEAVGAAAKVITLGIVGAATKNVTHKLIVAGRDQLDGSVYSFGVEIGDEAAEISQKMIDVVNGILGTPVIGTVLADDAVFTSKWKGITADELTITVDTGGNPGGITYSEDANVAGSGLASTADGTSKFGDRWNTLLINAVGSDSATLDALELFNGNANDKSGRYVSTVFKPIIALFGNNAANRVALVSAMTDARKDEMTNAFCPAPN